MTVADASSSRRRRRRNGADEGVGSWLLGGVMGRVKGSMSDRSNSCGPWCGEAGA